MIRKREGFSLIELLVVVLVIGVIASFATAKYQGFIARTRTAEGLRLLTSLYGAQERYKMQEDNYAGTDACVAYDTVSPAIDVQISKDPPDNFQTPRVCDGDDSGVAPHIVAQMQSTIANATSAIMRIDITGTVDCSGPTAECAILGY